MVPSQKHTYMLHVSNRGIRKMSLYCEQWSIIYFPDPTRKRKWTHYVKRAVRTRNDWEEGGIHLSWLEVEYRRFAVTLAILK